MTINRSAWLDDEGNLVVASPLLEELKLSSSGSTHHVVAPGTSSPIQLYDDDGESIGTVRINVIAFVKPDTASAIAELFEDVTVPKAAPKKNTKKKTKDAGGSI